MSDQNKKYPTDVETLRAQIFEEVEQSEFMTTGLGAKVVETFRDEDPATTEWLRIQESEDEQTFAREDYAEAVRRVTKVRDMLLLASEAGLGFRLEIGLQVNPHLAALTDEHIDAILDLDDCTEFVKEHPTCQMATRIRSAYKAEEVSERLKSGSADFRELEKSPEDRTMFRFGFSQVSTKDSLLAPKGPTDPMALLAAMMESAGLGG